jgi:hypothetical protein
MHHRKSEYPIRHLVAGLTVFAAIPLFVQLGADEAVSRVKPPDSAEPVTSTAATIEMARQRLLAAAKRGAPDFPDEKQVKLMHFSYVGTLATKDGPVLVVDRRAVITGMLAPRGLNYITFFDSRLKYLGKLCYTKSRPLYCDRGKLYLFGQLDGLPPAGQGNVIDLSLGYTSLRIYHEYAYGSSGGIPERNSRRRGK